MSNNIFCLMVYHDIDHPEFSLCCYTTDITRRGPFLCALFMTDICFMCRLFLSWKIKVLLLAVLERNCTLQYKCEALIFTDLQTKRPTKPEHPSLTSMDEEQELRELAERMGQLHAQETKEEVKKKDDYKRGGENTNKERRKKGRMASIEGEAEEQNLRKPVMETSPAQSHAASRCTRSSHSDPTVMKEQKQPSLCYPSPVTVSTADCQSGGGSTSNQEGEVRETHTDRAATGRGEEEQLAQSYVIVEHHMK